MTERLERHRSMLAKTPLFATVQPALLDELAAKAKVVRLDARETLFSKGDPGDRLYIVIKGLIRIGVLSAEGREITYALLGAGKLFGEIAVLDGGERSADASAMEPSELLALERRDVLAFLTRHPAEAQHLITVLCERLRRADELVEDMVFRSLPERLAKHLIGLNDAMGRRARIGGASEIHLSQQDVADHLGVSRESVNKVLSKWEQIGLVALGRGRIALNNLAELERLALPE